MHIWLRAGSAGVGSVLTLALGCLSSSGAAHREVGADLERLAQAHVERTGGPGFGYAVVTPAGVRSRGLLGEADPGDAFIWGSVSKPVTGAIARRSVERGRLDLDAPVTRYVTGCPALGSVRVTDLLHHTSGLDETYGVLDGASGAATATDAVADGTDDDLCPERPPGSYAYSSVNYLLLAAVVERANGTTYAELVRDVAGREAGAAGLVTSPADSARLAAPHRIVAGGPAAAPLVLDPAGLGYGYLGGTLEDLQHVARGFLGARPALGSPTADRGVPASGGERYGAGWRLRSLPDGTTLAWHSGTAPGWFTTIFVWPERELALVTVQNASGLLEEDALLDGPQRLAAALAPTGRPLADAPPGIAPTHIAGVVGLGAVAALTGVTASTRHRRRRPVVGVTLLVLAGLAAGAVAASGIPPRQFGLWVPDLAVAATLAWLGVAAAGLRLLQRPRRPPRRARPTAEGPSRPSA